MSEAGGRFLPWYRRNPHIFEQEKRILLDRGFRLDEELLAKDGIVTFTGRLEVDPEREIVLAYSDAFPSWPPSALDRSTKPVLRRHQRANDRHFCLFGFNRAGWCASMGAAEVLAEIEGLIRDFSQDISPSATDTAPEPTTTSIPYAYDIVVMVPPGVSDFDSPVEKTTVGSIILRHDRSGGDGLPAQGVVMALNIGGRVWNCAPAYKSLALRHTQMVTANAIVLPGAPGLDDLRRVSVEFFQNRAARKQPKEEWLALLFLEQSGVIHGTRLTWLFVRRRKEQQQTVRTYVYRPSERWSRTPGLTMISDKKVLLIGCGCLGSKIGTSLAASGVGDFGLLDYDLYDPNNVVRHEVGIAHFGQPKARALVDRLKDINPAIACRVFAYQVGGIQVFAEDERVMKEFAAADIVVNTTGDHGVSRWMDECCYRFGVPGIFVSVTNGAWGGEIVRVIPGDTACWLCWKAAYEHDAPAGAEEAQLFAPGCDQPTFTGTTYECGIVADAGCCMVVDTLLNRREIDGDYIRWRGRNANSYLFRGEVLRVPRGCGLCKAA
jgi:ThiF family